MTDLAAQAIAAYRKTITAYLKEAPDPWAVVSRVANDLADLDKQVDNAGLAAPALDAAQAAVDLLAGFTPDAAHQSAYDLALAEARQNLIIRLLENTRTAEAAALVAPALAGYRAYLAGPTPDLSQVNRDLSDLTPRLSAAGLTAEAAEAQALLDQTTPS